MSKHGLQEMLKSSSSSGTARENIGYESEIWEFQIKRFVIQIFVDDKITGIH